MNKLVLTLTCGFLASSAFAEDKDKNSKSNNALTTTGHVFNAILKGL